MSYIYLADAGEEYLAECFSDIPASVLLKSSPIAARCYSSGSETESCPDSQSGTTFAPSMESRGAGESMSSVEDSLVRTLAQQVKAPESTVNQVGYGEKWHEAFAKFDPLMCSWKIRQLWLFEDLDESLAIWPRWGWMQDGECWERTPPDFLITEPEFGWLPTPSGVNGGKNHTMGRVDEWGGSSNPLRGLPIGKALSPNFEEIVMGWPIDWTAQTPLEMAKFHLWLASHGKL